MIMLVGFPRILRKRALEVESLSNDHVVKVLRHGSLRVSFHHELEIAGLSYKYVSIDGGYK